MPTTTRRIASFRSETDVRSIPPPPAGRPAIHIPHVREPGFGVRVTPAKRNGQITRVWFVRLGTKRELLGRVGQVPLEDARVEAVKRRAAYELQNASGVLSSVTLGQAYDHFSKKRSDRWAPDTVRGYARDVPKLKPLWGVRLRQLNALRISGLLDDVKAKAMAHNLGRKIDKNGQAAAASVARLLNAVLNHAVAYDLLLKNPMKPLILEGATAANPRRSRHVPKAQIPAFWAWLHNEVHPEARDWILIDLFMCLRRSVMGRLSWKQVNRENWTILVSSESRGNKAKVDFSHPIPTYLIERVFRPRWENAGRHPEWVIESNKRRGQPLKNVRTILATAESKLGLVLSMHDIRRTGASWMRAATRDGLLVSRVLTHSLQSSDDMDATSAGYVIDSTESLRDGMNKTVEFVLSVVGSGKR